MSDLVAEVMLIGLVVSTIARNAALVFYLWWRYKKEKCEIEIVNRVLGDHDDETTD